MNSQFNIDSSIEYAISAGFFNLFSTELNTSVNTGYDWTKASSETTGEQVTIVLEGVAPAGYILKIEQAVGECGGNSPRTDMFKTSHLTADGEVVKVVYELGGKVIG